MPTAFQQSVSLMRAGFGWHTVRRSLVKLSGRMCAGIRYSVASCSFQEGSVHYGVASRSFQEGSVHYGVASCSFQEGSVHYGEPRVAFRKEVCTMVSLV